MPRTKKLGIGEEVIGSPEVSQPVEQPAPEVDAPIESSSENKLEIDAEGNEWVITPSGVRFLL